jgi:small subunit ribosomal protein S17
MADKKKNEKTEKTPVEEAPVVEETPAAEAETVVEETPVTETETVVEEPPTPEVETVVEEPAAEVETVVEETPAAEAETVVEEPPAAEPEAAAVEAPAAEAEAPEAPAGKKPRSRKHIPRSARRTRTSVVREKPKTRKAITRIPKPESELGRRQERRGVVISDKGEKTIVVKVDVIKSHPKYKKVVRSTVRFHAHDEANTAGVGDTVRIVETRPLSKLKRWRLAEIVEKAR